MLNSRYIPTMLCKLQCKQTDVEMQQTLAFVFQKRKWWLGGGGGGQLRFYISATDSCHNQHGQYAHIVMLFAMQTFDFCVDL